MSGTRSEHLLLRAARRQPVERPPVWILRQAGRYMPEYRKIRERVDFTTLLRTPDLAVEVSLLPLRILGVDTAIIFSDILVPLEAMGLRVRFPDGGPVIDEPVDRPSRADALGIPDPEAETPFLFQSIRALVEELSGSVPVIGFTGGPFTLACYMVEGNMALGRGGTGIRAMAYREPTLLHGILEKVTRTVVAYLKAQAEAGAGLVQIFDTWAGLLAPDLFRTFALDYARRAIEDFKAAREEPVILYARGSGTVLEGLLASGADVLGLDWTVDLADARRRVADRAAIQGNLDPAALLSDPQTVRDLARRMVACAEGPGYIANLGHGILPQTPVECAQAFVEAVKGSVGDAAGGRGQPGTGRGDTHGGALRDS